MQFFGQRRQESRQVGGTLEFDAISSRRVVVPVSSAFGKARFVSCVFVRNQLDAGGVNVGDVSVRCRLFICKPVLLYVCGSPLIFACLQRRKRNEGRSGNPGFRLIDSGAQPILGQKRITCFLFEENIPLIHKDHSNLGSTLLASPSPPPSSNLPSSATSDMALWVIEPL